MSKYEFVHKNMKEGNRYIWKPVYIKNFQRYPDTEHPWYGHEVEVTFVSVVYDVHQIKIVNAPETNNSAAYYYWVNGYELEDIKR